MAIPEDRGAMCYTNRTFRVFIYENLKKKRKIFVSENALCIRKCDDNTKKKMSAIFKYSHLKVILLLECNEKDDIELTHTENAGEYQQVHVFTFE